MMSQLNTYGMVQSMGAPIPAKYLYNVIREIWQTWGYKAVDLFIPPDEKTATKEMAEQMAMQAQAQQMVMMATGGMNGMAGPNQGAIGVQQANGNPSSGGSPALQPGGG
jgi:hypothetical protein